MMDEAAPKGYVCLVDHALAESEVCVWQVGQSLQQNLGSHCSLEVSWIELVSVGGTDKQFSWQVVLAGNRRMFLEFYSDGHISKIFCYIQS